MGQVIQFRRPAETSESDAEIAFRWLDQMRQDLGKLEKGGVSDGTVRGVLHNARAPRHLALVGRDAS